MHISNFRHYLKYLDCEEVEAQYGSHYLYVSPEGKKATIPARQGEIHPYDVVLVCLGLGLPVPPQVEFTSICHRLKDVWKDAL